MHHVERLMVSHSSKRLVLLIDHISLNTHLYQIKKWIYSKHRIKVTIFTWWINATELPKLLYLYLHFFLCNQYCCVNAKYLFAIPIATMASNRDGKTVQQWVDDCITSQPVVVFSKTYCPFCDMAKVRIWKYLFKKIWLTINVTKLYFQNWYIFVWQRMPWVRRESLTTFWLNLKIEKIVVRYKTIYRI